MEQLLKDKEDQILSFLPLTNFCFKIIPGVYSRKSLNLLIDFRTQVQALIWCYQLPQYDVSTQHQISVISRNSMLSRDYPIFACEKTDCFVKTCQRNLQALNTVKILGI